MKTINAKSWHFKLVKLVFQSIATRRRISLCQYFWMFMASIPLSIIIGVLFVGVACIYYSYMGIKYVSIKTYKFVMPEIKPKVKREKKYSGAWCLIGDFFHSVHRKVCPLYEIEYFPNDENKAVEGL